MSESQPSHVNVSSQTDNHIHHHKMADFYPKCTRCEQLRHDAWMVYYDHPSESKAEPCYFCFVTVVRGDRHFYYDHPICDQCHRKLDQ